MPEALAEQRAPLRLRRQAQPDQGHPNLKFDEQAAAGLLSDGDPRFFSLMRVPLRPQRGRRRRERWAQSGGLGLDYPAGSWALRSVREHGGAAAAAGGGARKINDRHFYFYPRRHLGKFGFASIPVQE